MNLLLISMQVHSPAKIRNIGLCLKNKAITFLLILFYTSNLTANAQSHQSGQIKGTVTTVDGAPAQGISVKLKNTKKGTIANTYGNFEFKNLAVGNYTVEISMVGYETSTAEASITEDKRTAEISVQLDFSSRKLDEVIISSGGNRFAKKESDDVSKMPISNMENPQVYSVVSKELMKEQIVTDYNSAFKNVPGAGIAEVRNQGRTTSISRGFATPQLVRNGVGSFTYSSIDPANLERIEVIKGPSATLFGST